MRINKPSIVVTEDMLTSIRKDVSSAYLKLAGRSSADREDIIKVCDKLYSAMSKIDNELDEPEEEEDN